MPRSSESGQSSVEAAVMLPTLLLTLALVLQPACLLYTRCVMLSAASETARAAATATVSTDDLEAFCLRRLSAVPDVDLFHAGGDDGWEIEVTASSGSVAGSVKVSGGCKPLPLTSAIATALGLADDGLVRLEVEVSCQARPSWITGSYGSWITMWGG